MNPDLLDRCAAALTVLARLQLTPPDEETMDQVAGLAGQWPLSGLPQETPDAQQARENGWQLLKTSRRDGESAEHVRDDQDRLYGITARALIPPYESVHRNTDGLIFDAATLDVRSMYRRAGLRAPALGREPDDHLGLELDFLASRQGVQGSGAAVGAVDAGPGGADPGHRPHFCPGHRRRRPSAGRRGWLRDHRSPPQYPQHPCSWCPCTISP